MTWSSLPSYMPGRGVVLFSTVCMIRTVISAIPVLL